MLALAVLNGERGPRSGRASGYSRRWARRGVRTRAASGPARLRWSAVTTAPDAPADAAPAERLSEVEERVERIRRTAGLFLAPLVFAALLIAPLGLPAPAHRLAAILAAVVVLWVCESLPLAITAIVGPVLAVLLQVAPARQVFASFAAPVVLVFIGGFIAAAAMFGQ